MSDKTERDTAVIIGLLRDSYQHVKDENDRLCELVEKMARALGVGSDWCNRECGEEFGCTGDENGVTGRCAIVDAMEELGWPVVEVEE